MTTRRTLPASATLLASATVLKSASAQSAVAAAKQADFLFVQTANGMSFDQSAGKLTLQG